MSRHPQKLRSGLQVGITTERLLDEEASLGRVEQRYVLLVPPDAKVGVPALAEDLEDQAAPCGALAGGIDLDPVPSLRRTASLM